MQGLPNHLYPTSSHLQWEEYFRDAASQESGDIDTDLSSSEEDIVDISSPTLQPKHELSAYAKPYIPAFNRHLPTHSRWSPVRFSGPLFGLPRLEDICFCQISNPAPSIFVPLSSPLDHQELVFCPELIRFLDDLLSIRESPLAPSPLPIIHASRYAFRGTHQRDYPQPPPPPPNHPLAAPVSGLALDSESDFPSLVANPRNPGVKSSPLSAVSACPPPPTRVNSSFALPASHVRPVPTAVAVQPQVPAVVRMLQAADETALFTFMQLPKKSHHCTYNINGLVLSVRNVIKVGTLTSNQPVTRPRWEFVYDVLVWVVAVYSYAVMSPTIVA